MLEAFIGYELLQWKMMVIVHTVLMKRSAQTEQVLRSFRIISRTVDLRSSPKRDRVTLTDEQNNTISESLASLDFQSKFLGLANEQKRK